MFAGHYGASLLARALDRTIPLWLLFLATQLLDLGWVALILLGVEKARVAPGITASMPLDLYYMPYTHSLIAALAWSLAAAVAYRGFRVARGVPTGRRTAFLLGLVVLSHWLLDLLVHRPDLPLYDDSAKVGLGLWNHRVLAVIVEAVILGAGLWAYLSSDPRPRRRGALVGLATLVLLTHVVVLVGPPPPSVPAAAVLFLAGYLLFAVAAWWADRPIRQEVTMPPPHAR